MRGNPGFARRCCPGAVSGSCQLWQHGKDVRAVSLGISPALATRAAWGAVPLTVRGHTRWDVDGRAAAFTRNLTPDDGGGVPAFRPIGVRHQRVKARCAETVPRPVSGRPPALEDLHLQASERLAAGFGNEPRVLHVEALAAILGDRMWVHREDHVCLQRGLDALADPRELD